MFKAYAEDHGKPHPALLAKPQPRDDCVKYLEAFRLLGCSRIWDQVGPKPTQTSEIESMLNLLGITDTSTRLKYLRLIRRMDMTELAIQQEAMRRNTSK